MLSTYSSLKRRTPLKTKTPLKAKTPLKRKTPLAGKSALKRGKGYAKPSAPSIMQEEKRCYLTGKTENLVKHHIYPGARRKASDEWGCWVWLTAAAHTGAAGVHSSAERMRELQAECYRRFVALYGVDKFVEVFGH